MNKKEHLNDVWDISVKPEENLYYWNGDPIISKVKSRKNSKLKVVEFFCGCGGTSLGFEMAGFEVILGVDIHKPSIDTFKLNHKNASTILGDIKKINPSEVRKLLAGTSPDILIAGVPCPGFSLNNRKRHENDERNLLYLEFIKFVQILKPKSLMLENVKGMGSTGDFVSRIEKDLSESSKMDVRSKVLCAADYGVPQNRERLVFVGTKNKTFDFNKIKSTNGPNATNPYNNVSDAIVDLPSLQAKESKSFYASAPLGSYQKLMRKNAGTKLFNHTAPGHPASTIEKIANTKPGEPMYKKYKQRIRLKLENLSPTQVSGGIRPQFQFGHPIDARGLSIRERCRLQSFPDDFIMEGGIVQSRVQTGNAVPPLLAKAVAMAIKDHLK